MEYRQATIGKQPAIIQTRAILSGHGERADQSSSNNEYWGTRIGEDHSGGARQGSVTCLTRSRKISTLHAPRSGSIGVAWMDGDGGSATPDAKESYLGRTKQGTVCVVALLLPIMVERGFFRA